MRIYSEQSVNDLAARFEKRAERRSHPPAQARIPKSKTEIAVSSQAVTTLESVLTEWLNRAQPKFWLTWEQAEQLSGIPARHIRALSEDGKIYAERFGRSWRVLRDSLQQFAGSNRKQPQRINAHAAGK